jgi:hypothetical protein
MNQNQYFVTYFAFQPLTILVEDVIAFSDFGFAVVLMTDSYTSLYTGSRVIE